MMKVLFMLKTIIKRTITPLCLFSFVIVVCFLQRHSFISGKREFTEPKMAVMDKSGKRLIKLLGKMNRAKDTALVTSSGGYLGKRITDSNDIEAGHFDAKTQDIAIKAGGDHDLVNKKEMETMPLRRKYTKNVANRKLYELSRHSRVDTDIIDIMGKPSLNFIHNYKNPCFMGDKTSGLFNDNRLHCLPYFYLIGVKKSGTTDLFHRISSHPEFRGPGFKEAQWFPRIRLGIDCLAFRKHQALKRPLRKGIDNRSIKYYISMFDSSASAIKSCPSKCITGEATPANLHMHTRWQLLPGNEKMTEPRFTNFHYIKHITPGAKIIVIFRDPVSRLFSDFMHELRLRHAQHSLEKVTVMFHHQVSVLIRTYEWCFKTWSERRCIYNNTLSDDLTKKGIVIAESFRAGFYAFYMKELMSVFGREQIFPVLMTDYLSKPQETLTKIFQFLKMSPLSSTQMTRIVNLKVANSSKNKRLSGATMDVETKDLLYRFYSPFNKEMAGLLKNRGYLFT